MNLFNNDIKNNYIEIINNYFNEWSKIKNAEDYKMFASKTPPTFGIIDTPILQQINHFIDLGVQIECNKSVTLRDFKNDIKKISEDLQVYY